MRLTTLKLLPATALFLFGALGLLLPRPAAGTQPYNNPGPFVDPWLNPTSAPGLPSPAKVPGKELSLGGSGELVFDWDGLGGTMFGIDYSGSSRPNYSTHGKVDALANFADTLFQETLNDNAHLIFSTRMTGYEGQPEKPPLANGNVIGAGDELSYELAGAYAPASSQGLWASRADINAPPGLADMDAVELWGPEPNLSTAPPLLGDSNRYSLENDADSGVSVWLRKKNADGTYTSLPYVPQSMVVAAVLAQLGPPQGLNEQQLASQIDVDALMAYDMPGTSTLAFDGLDPVDGPWDRILFSIRRVSDMIGLYATGSEIFWLDASGASGFLHHGGHDWDKEYALENLRIDRGPFSGPLIPDIDALEAVAIQVPEPCTATLLLAALTMLGWRSRQRKSS